MDDTGCTFVKAGSAKTSFDLKVKRAFLESHGIPTIADSDAANELYGLSNLPMMSYTGQDPFAIMVPEDRLDETENLLKEIPLPQGDNSIQIVLLDWKHEVVSLAGSLPQNSADDLVDMTKFRFLGETETEGKTWQFFVTHKDSGAFNFKNAIRFEPFVKLSPRISGFLESYCTVILGQYQLPGPLYEIFGFCGEPKLATKLGKLVLEGKKTATASLYWAYEEENFPVPQIGGISIVVDGEGNPLCAIETTNVEIIPFNEVGNDHAREEGEGDLSLAYWRKAHKEFFTAGRETLKPFTESAPVLCERFKVVKRF